MLKGTTKQRLLLLLAFLSTGILNASHNDDGWIHFKHLSGTQNDYVITLYQVLLLPRDSNTLYINDIYISDGNLYDTTVTLPLVNPPAALTHFKGPQAWWAASYNCLSINGSAQHYQNDYYVYRDTIRLPHSARFTLTKLLNPTSSKANIVDNSGSQIITAIIDNRFGPVSLPLMSRDMLDRFLPEDQWLWKGHIDTSYLSPGDSFSQAFYHGYFEDGGSYNPLPYKPGFTAQQPLGSNRSLIQNRTTFPFRFKIIDDQDYMLIVRMSVKRFSTQSQTWIEVGSSEHDFTFIGWDSTNNISNQVQFSNLSTGGLSPICGDSLIYLKTNATIYPPSLDNQGTQFWLQGANGQIHPVIEAQQLGPDSIRIRTQQALNVNQTYSLQIRPDLNSGQQIQSVCGIAFPLDTLNFTIQDCALGLKTQEAQLKIYPNPSQGLLRIDNTPLGSRYEIWTLNGMTVAEGSVENQLELDLKPGLYLILIKDASGESLTKKKLLIRN